MTFEQAFGVAASDLICPGYGPEGASRGMTGLPGAQRKALEALDPWSLIVQVMDNYGALCPLTHYPIDQWAKGSCLVRKRIALFNKACVDDPGADVPIPVGRLDPLAVPATGSWRTEPWWFNPFKLRMEPAQQAIFAPGYRGWAWLKGNGYSPWAALRRAKGSQMPKYQQTSQAFRTFFMAGIYIDRETLNQSVLAKEKPWTNQ